MWPPLTLFVLSLVLCVGYVGIVSAVTTNTASGVVVERIDKTIINATNTVQAYSLARLSVPTSAFPPGKPMSFALSDKGGFGRLNWGAAQYGVQGSTIGKKMLSFGGDAELTTVRSWLQTAHVLEGPLDNPVNAGLVFCTDGGLWHGGASGQGCFDANAELVLLARDTVAHAGHRRSLTQAPFRLMCVGGNGPSSSNWTVPSVPQQPTSPPVQTRWTGPTCTSPVSSLMDANVALYPHYVSPPTGQQATFGGRGNSPGWAISQAFHTDTSFSSLRLPFVPHNSKDLWPFTVVVLPIDASPTTPPVASSSLVSNFTAFDSGWLDVPLGAPLPAGAYLVEFRPAGSAPHLDVNQAYFLGAGWVTDNDPFPLPSPSSSSSSSAVVLADGGAGHRNFDSTNSTRCGPHQRVNVSVTLQAAMEWQVRHAALQHSNESFGILTIRDVGFTGAPQPDGFPTQVGSNGYFDVVQFGFRDGYIHLKFLQSISAYLELEAAGLVPSLAPTFNLSSILAQSTAAFEDQFVSKEDGTVLGWIGCENASPTAGSLCPDLPPTPGDGQLKVNYSSPFLQSLALSVIPSSSLIRAGFDSIVRASRMSPPTGMFRVTTNGFRGTNTNATTEKYAPPVTLWRARSRWALVDPSTGFAIDSPKQTGDWHIFRQFPDGVPGYGGFGFQEENGGVLLSSTAYVFETGPYGVDIMKDFASLVEGVDRITGQLTAGDTSSPLLDGHTQYLRPPVNSSVIKTLCQNVRPSSVGVVDAWGTVACDHYKSPSWDLPEAGAFPFAFAQGVLGLTIPVPVVGGGQPSVLVYGTRVVAGTQAPVVVPFPSSGLANRFPSTLAEVAVNGLRVHGGVYDLTCRESKPGVALTCSMRELVAPASQE